jgi:hypothetical protein
MSHELHIGVVYVYTLGCIFNDNFADCDLVPATLYNITTSEEAQRYFLFITNSKMLVIVMHVCIQAF